MKIYLVLENEQERKELIAFARELTRSKFETFRMKLEIEPRDVLPPDAFREAVRNLIVAIRNLEHQS